MSFNRESERARERESEGARARGRGRGRVAGRAAWLRGRGLHRRCEEEGSALVCFLASSRSLLLARFGFAAGARLG